MSTDMYRGFYLSFDYPPIPYRHMDWSATDGEDPEVGQTNFYGATVEEVKAQIDEYLEEQGDE